MLITMRTSIPCSNPLFLGLFTTEKELSGKTNNQLSGKTPGMHQSEDVPKEAEDFLFSASSCGLLMWSAGSWDEWLCHSVIWGAENCNPEGAEPVSSESYKSKSSP